MLDEERIIVEKRQEPLIKALKNWGFKPIPCAFENYFPFLGSFHCATLDTDGENYNHISKNKENCMYVMGINSVFHESAACLLKDGTILVAAEEERFNRTRCSSF